MPNLQQRNFLFDYNYALSHNLTRSLRFNFSAATSSIIRQNTDINSSDLQTSDNQRILWQDIMSTGEPNSHFQSLALNYKLPFQYIPFLSFIDATYNYTGNFNWQRGSEALAGVTSEDGIALGLVNTIQNNNTKTITGALSFSRLYSALGLETNKNRFKAKVVNSQDKDSVKKNTIFKKSLTKVVDILTAIKRVQASYNENHGSVLPGYLPSVGFAGGLKPTLGYTLGSQAEIRYEVARQRWLTGLPNFNQS